MLESSTVKGEIAVRRFDLECLKLGYGVSAPISELRYDRVVDREGKLYRVQIKWCNSEATNSENAFLLRLSTWRNKKRVSASYSDGEIDALIVYLPSVDRLYWFPPEVFNGKTSLTLRVKPAKNNQKVFDIEKYRFGVLA